MCCSACAGSNWPPHVHVSIGAVFRATRAALSLRRRLGQGRSRKMLAFGRGMGSRRDVNLAPLLRRAGEGVQARVFSRTSRGFAARERLHPQRRPGRKQGRMTSLKRRRSIPRQPAQARATFLGWRRCSCLGVSMSMVLLGHCRPRGEDSPALHFAAKGACRRTSSPTQACWVLRQKGGSASCRCRRRNGLTGSTREPTRRSSFLGSAIGARARTPRRATAAGGRRKAPLAGTEAKIERYPLRVPRRRSTRSVRWVETD